MSPADAKTQRILRRYSYSDRIRYYWADSEIQIAQSRLMSNLADHDIPLPLLSQHLPNQYARVRRGELSLEPEALVLDHIRDVLRVYASACTPRPPVLRRSLVTILPDQLEKRGVEQRTKA